MIKKTCILALLGTLTVAQAAVVENFDYTAGTALNDAGVPGTSIGNGGSGWGSNWFGNSGLSFDAVGANVISKTWSTPTGYGFTPTGSAIQNDQASSNVPYRQLGAGNTIDFGADGTYYFSFLFRKDTSNNAAFNFGIGNSSGGTSTPGTTNPWTGMQLGAGGSGNGIQAGSRDAAGNKAYLFTTGLSLGQDLLIAGRLTTFASGSSNDTIAFNIYTSADTLPGTAPGSFTYAAGSSAQTGIADRITLGASVTGNDSTGVIATDAIWDEFRLGNDWNAVAIPEPSTFALVGIALGALVFFRRRK